MPIFEFQREDCGEVFEELILGNDSDKVICKKCKSSNVKKLFHKSLLNQTINLVVL